VIFFQAQKMVETMAEAFEFTYKRVEKRREQREVGGNNILRVHYSVGKMVINVNMFESIARQVLVMGPTLL
jgi:hypothetical protein